MSTHDDTPSSRRIFLKVSGAAALAPAATDALAARGIATPTAGPRPGGAGDLQGQGRRFFTAPEAAFIEAAVQRLIPRDALGPGALEAGVATFIDAQLAGAWGAGERLYRGGPWAEGTPSQGYQLPYSPAELFRTALRGIAADLQKQGGKPFDQLDGAAQDAYLTELQNGRRELDGVPSKVFFESLLAMTVEGYFGDPVYGGNRDMSAWRMIGFPGAYASYYHDVDRHGAAFRAEPVSLAQRGEQVHVMADIPAFSPVPAGPHRHGR